MEKKAQIRYELFAKEYVLDLNGTRAAIAAGYSEKGADSKASQLLGNVKVQALIQELTERRMKGLDLSADKLLEELAISEAVPRPGERHSRHQGRDRQPCI